MPSWINKRINKWIYKLASPKHCYAILTRIMPWLRRGFFVLVTFGLILGLLYAPADYQQGDAFRIIYIHVPSAILSLGVFVLMAIMAAIFLIWRIKIADVLASASAPLGALFTVLALITGSLWGRPMWGTYWIFGPRLTSELILLFIYIGVIALRQAIPNRELAARVTSIFTLVGVVDVPIIHFSVYWWHSLHQQSSLLRIDGPSIGPMMLYPLLLMISAWWLYYAWMLCLNARRDMLWRERHNPWVQEV